jgi:two-component system, chemotaxis family, CheB/CheR fusion protein
MLNTYSHNLAVEPIIYIVDDDIAARTDLREWLEEDGRAVQDFSNSEDFLMALRPGGEDCVVIDANLPGISGIALLEHLKESRHWLPAIMMSGCGGVSVAVRAMKAGAVDFIEKPASCDDLIASIDRALDLSRDAAISLNCQAKAAADINGLTPRQHEVMNMVLDGHPSKNIAADLHISQRTVENHRASIMRRTGAKSLPALARLALAAAG